MDNLEGVLSRRQAFELKAARHRVARRSSSGVSAAVTGNWPPALASDITIAPSIGRPSSSTTVPATRRPLGQRDVNSFLGQVIGVDRLAADGQKAVGSRFDGINPGAGHLFGKLPVEIEDLLPPFAGLPSSLLL